VPRLIRRASDAAEVHVLLGEFDSGLLAQLEVQLDSGDAVV
jgi:hypothetical protein